MSTIQFTHPKFGCVVSYGTHGLGCVDCGEDAHEGDCVIATCKECGAEVSTGCSLHPLAEIWVSRKPRVAAEHRAPSKVFRLTAIGDGDRSVGESPFRENVTLRVSDLRGDENEFLAEFTEFLANWFDVRGDRVMTVEQFEELTRQENEAESAMERQQDEVEAAIAYITSVEV